MRLLIHLMVTAHYRSRVPPFGYPGIKAYLQLPQAFRSLSRPSSAISAMASTLRSFMLDLASTVLPFLRLLRWKNNLICGALHAFALPFPSLLLRSSVPASSRRHASLECFLCSFQGAMSNDLIFRCLHSTSEVSLEPSKRYSEEFQSEYSNRSYGLSACRITGFRFQPLVSVAFPTPYSLLPTPFSRFRPGI